MATPSWLKRLGNALKSTLFFWLATEAAAPADKAVGKATDALDKAADAIGKARETVERVPTQFPPIVGDDDESGV